MVVSSVSSERGVQKDEEIMGNNDSRNIAGIVQLTLFRPVNVYNYGKDFVV